MPDANGNFYISDNFTNRVFKVSASGTLTVVAGNIVPTFGGHTHDGFLGTDATLNSPKQVAVDTNGNLYIADSQNHAIRFVNLGSTTVTFYGTIPVAPNDIETIVGVDGTPCNGAAPCGDGGPATSANLTSPAGVWLDSTNNIYIADTVDDVIRVVNTGANPVTIAGVVNIQPGDIVTIAGNYTPCSAAPCGDGGAGTSAQLNNPTGIWLDANNDIFIADTLDQIVREVNATSGTITRIAGNYSTSCPLTSTTCGDGASALSADLNNPEAVFADTNGNIYVADNADQVVRVFTIGGNISLVAGTYHTACTTNCGDGGAATAATLSSPTGVALDGSGNLLIADSDDDAIRKVPTPLSGTANISTAMGMILNPEYSGDAKPPSIPGTPTDASLYNPLGVAKDAAGNIYIADPFNSVVREVTAAGVMKTFAGTGSICRNSTCGDGGPPASAQLSGPTGVAVDATGNVYIVDTQDSIIRVVNMQKSAISVGSVKGIAPGTIKTVAGDISKRPGYCCDGKPATTNQLSAPDGMTIDKAGNLYIADGNLTNGGSNNIIRVVNTQSAAIKVAGVTIGPGNMNIVAGTPQTGCAAPTDACGDGGSAKSAQLNGPTGVTVDLSGNIYIADNNDNRIRAVSASGTIKTLAGTGNACQGGCGDNAPATNATLTAPYDVFADYDGTVYIADTQDYVVRVVNPGSTTITVNGIAIPAGYINTIAGLGSHGFSGDGGPATEAQLAGPSGLAADSTGNLYVTDNVAWRVRTVKNLIATAATASLSPGSLDFPSTVVGDTNKLTITITNSGNITELAVTEPLVISGADKSDFSETDNCNTPVKPLGGTCTVTVTFAPSAVGSRSASLTITDNASNSPQIVALSGTGSSFVVSPSSQTVVAGSAATYSVSISGNGFPGAVTLSCVSGLPTGASCSFSPNPLKVGQTSTLTISTTEPSSALMSPASKRSSAPLYAVWLLLPAMLLSTAGMSLPKRKKLISYFLLALAVAGVLFLVACGGGSSSGSGGGGTGSGGTPSGTYTIKIQGTSGSTTGTLNRDLDRQLVSIKAMPGPIEFRAWLNCSLRRRPSRDTMPIDSSYGKSAVTRRFCDFNQGNSNAPLYSPRSLPDRARYFSFRIVLCCE